MTASLNESAALLDAAGAQVDAYTSTYDALYDVVQVCARVFLVTHMPS